LLRTIYIINFNDFWYFDNFILELIILKYKIDYFKTSYCFG
jgi:hypothetical protein